VIRTLVAVAVASVVFVAEEIWRRGYLAPVAYGCRCWLAAVHPETEPEIVA